MSLLENIQNGTFDQTPAKEIASSALKLGAEIAIDIGLSFVMPHVGAFIATAALMQVGEKIINKLEEKWDTYKMENTLKEPHDAKPHP